VALEEAHCPIFCMRMELEDHIGDVMRVEGKAPSSSQTKG
jgi:hypothetical protein